VRNDSVIHLGTYGLRDGHQPTTPRTAFYIGSSTKSFTALTAALLAQRGKVDLDQPITRYVPEFALPPPLDAKRVTLRVMLSHRGGFDSDPLTFRTAFSGTLGEDSLLAVLTRTATPVDTSFEYTNTQYIIAARVLERVTGTPWQDLLAREVFAAARPARGDRARLASGPQTRRRPAGRTVRRDGGGLPPKVDATMHAAGGHVHERRRRRALAARAAGGRSRGRCAGVPTGRRRQHARADLPRSETRSMASRASATALAGSSAYWGPIRSSITSATIRARSRTSRSCRRGTWAVAVFIDSELRPFGQAADRIAELAYDVALGRDAPTAATLPAASPHRSTAWSRRTAKTPSAAPRARAFRRVDGAPTPAATAAPNWGTLDGRGARRQRRGAVRHAALAARGDGGRYAARRVAAGRSGRRCRRSSDRTDAPRRSRSTT
jgi:hypothetical protein